MAMAEKIPTALITRENFYNTNQFTETLRNHNITFIVLAGFLWKIPSQLVAAFQDNIVNIHPALLPRYGGRGMYGHFVHEAVHAAHESESGITIHRVNDNYDEGEIIFQARVAILPGDTPTDIENKVRGLEMKHYPEIIEEILVHRNRQQQKNQKY